MGCFFAAILVFFVLPLGTCFFASTLPRDMRNDRSLNELVVDVLVLGAIFGGILGLDRRCHALACPQEPASSAEDTGAG